MTGLQKRKNPLVISPKFGGVGWGNFQLPKVLRLLKKLLHGKPIYYICACWIHLNILMHKVSDAGEASMSAFGPEEKYLVRLRQKIK
jgi:hypothetical protein